MARYPELVPICSIYECATCKPTIATLENKTYKWNSPVCWCPGHQVLSAITGKGPGLGQQEGTWHMSLNHSQNWERIPLAMATCRKTCTLHFSTSSLSLHGPMRMNGKHFQHRWKPRCDASSICGVQGATPTHNSLQSRQVLFSLHFTVEVNRSLRLSELLRPQNKELLNP